MNAAPREPGANATAGDLLELVRTGRADTRSGLRVLTGLSRTAVVTRVQALTTAGLLLVGEELASTGGRPPGALLFNARPVSCSRSRSGAPAASSVSLTSTGPSSPPTPATTRSVSVPRS